MKHYYLLEEGLNKNDASLSQILTSKKDALRQAKKSRYPYRIVNQYLGTENDELANYINTLYETVSKTEVGNGR